VSAKHVAQVFYVLDTTDKRLMVVIPRKWQIIGVENDIDEEEFVQFDMIPSFVTSMIKPRIPSANKAPYLHNDHHEKVNNSKKPIPQRKVAQWLCKISSMCENMVSCLKMWLVLNICVKYAKCVKIWPFVWKIDFHWIFVSMIENIVICVKILLSLDIFVKYTQCVKIWMFLKCEQFPEVFYSVSGEVCSFWQSKREIRLENARLTS
jgi:hypothetical protein